MPLNEHKLLLAFEVGPTYSGVSYSILEPGKKPEIQALHKFLGQELPSGNPGVSSVSNKAIAVGALSDLLKYLYNRTKQHIRRVRPGIGTAIWNVPEIHYILSHPNGWKEPQCSLLRQAVEMAGLMNRGRNQISFVAQGEAILNLYADNGLLGDLISRGDGIIIVDAGEGTLGISAYTSPNGGRTFEEIAAPRCSSEGSVFVTEAAGEYLYKLLKNSKFLKDIPNMKRHFAQTTQRTFSDHNDTFSIRVGPVDGKNVKLGISGGRLRLGGEVIGSFFKPSIKHIVDDVLSQRRVAKKSISAVLLIGSFSTNDYVFQCVKKSLKSHGLQVLRPDAQANQLVTNGAVSSVLKRLSAPATRTSNITPLSTRAPTATIDRLSNHSRQMKKPFELHDDKVSMPDEQVEVITDSATSSVPKRPTPVVKKLSASPIHTPAVTILTITPPQALPPLTSPSLFNKLTDNNYYEWKMDMTALLVSGGLFDVVEGVESHPGGAEGTKDVERFRSIQLRACAEIRQHVSPSQLIYCSDDDPMLIWSALATAHAGQKRANINSLRRQFHKLRLGNGEGMSAFIERAQRMAFLLNEAGVGVNDDDLIAFITSGLPSCYACFLASLDSLPDSERDLDSILALLIVEHQRQMSAPLLTSALPIPDEIVVSTPYSSSHIHHPVPQPQR